MPGHLPFPRAGAFDLARNLTFTFSRLLNAWNCFQGSHAWAFGLAWKVPLHSCTWQDLQICPWWRYAQALGPRIGVISRCMCVYILDVWICPDYINLCCFWPLHESFSSILVHSTMSDFVHGESMIKWSAFAETWALSISCLHHRCGCIFWDVWNPAWRLEAHCSFVLDIGVRGPESFEGAWAFTPCRSNPQRSAH